MKIGRDEIGIVGLIGLTLILPASFLIFYGIFRLLLYTFIGIIILIAAVPMYYFDLYEHRKKRKTGTR